MTATKRFVGQPTPNEHPRAANAALLMANLAAIQAAGQHAVVELRGFGLHSLADSLLAEVEKVRYIHRGAQTRLRDAEDRALLAGISAMVGDEMREAGLAAGSPAGTEDRS
jgi:hypothetical protein